MNESTMTRFLCRVILITTIMILAILITPLCSRAQLDPRLEMSTGRAIAAVNKAEAAGATPHEILPLVTLLNRALQLNQEALNLPTQTAQRDDLLSRGDQILTNVTSQADALASRSAQRTHFYRIGTYVSAVLAAIVGTIAFASLMAFYQKYRIKRTFQMRIERK